MMKRATTGINQNKRSQTTLMVPEDAAPGMSMTRTFTKQATSRKLADEEPELVKRMSTLKKKATLRQIREEDVAIAEQPEISKEE